MSVTFNNLTFITINVCLSTEKNIHKIKHLSREPLIELTRNDLVFAGCWPIKAKRSTHFVKTFSCLW